MNEEKVLGVLDRLLGSNKKEKNNGGSVVENYYKIHGSSAVYSGLAIAGLVATISTIFKWAREGKKSLQNQQQDGRGRRHERRGFNNFERR